MAAVAPVSPAAGWCFGAGDTDAPLLQTGQPVWAAALLLAALDLGVFEALGRGPRSLAQLRRQCRLEVAHVSDLADALLGYGWVARDGDGANALYMGTRRAARELDRRSAGYVGDALKAWHAPAHTWSRLLIQMLRGQHSGPTQVPELSPISLRDALADFHGQALALSLQLPARACLLVVHGGAGRATAALTHAHPQVDGIALEPANELERARAHLASRGLAQRVQLRCEATAQMAGHAWPPCEVLLLYQVLLPGCHLRHAQDLQRAHAALRSNGLLVVVDLVLDTPRRDSADALTLALVHRAMGEDIAPLDRDQWAQLLGRAGFDLLQSHAMAGGARALLARRASVA